MVLGFERIGTTVYRFRKISKAEAIALSGLNETYLEENAEAHDYQVFTINGGNQAKYLAEVVPYLMPVKLIRGHVNLDKMKLDNRIPLGSVCRHRTGELSWSFLNGRRWVDISFPDKESMKDYLFFSEDDCLIAEVEEVCYLGRNNSVELAVLSAAGKPLDMWNYYKCSPEMIDALSKEGGVSIPDISEDDEAIFYCRS